MLIRTLIHARVPDRLRGRAFAAYNALRNGAEMGAPAAGGLLVAAVGPRWTLLLAGTGAVVAGLGGLVLSSRPAKPTLGEDSLPVGPAPATDVLRTG